jgi:membrane-bound lytic murein transglycosylase D
MTFTTSNLIISKKSVCYFFILALVAALQKVSAQSGKHINKKPVLASVEKRIQPALAVKKSLAIFPEILKGNEEEALSYIEKFSTKRRDYLIRMYSKGKQLLPKAAIILSKYSLPAELKILLTLESAYNPSAVSKAGAVGYWQIMDEVAKEYGMKYITQQFAGKTKEKKLKRKRTEKKRSPIVRIKDDRKNFVASTHTAACYLRDRRRNLDDNWLLIVASYNCGIGNVWKAMERSEKIRPTFWDIKNYLPAETRAYVMNFITLNVIFHNYELFLKHKLIFKLEKVESPTNSEKYCAVERSEYFD